MKKMIFTRSLPTHRLRHFILLTTLLFLVFGLTLITNASESQPSRLGWSVGLGGNPARNSLSALTGPTAPDVLWQGSIYSWSGFQPYIEGDIVVMTRTQGESNPFDHSLIVAQDLNTGAILWTANLPEEFPSPSLNRVIGMRDGRVYAERKDQFNIYPNSVYALNAANGSILWRSASLITDDVPGHASFAPNGDLIIGNWTTLIRIRAADGTTVWEVPKECPVTSGCSASVFGNKAYVWTKPINSNYRELTAINLRTGNSLYQAPPSGLITWQTLPFVGPDGTVYAPYVGIGADNAALIAYEDTGAALVEKWRAPFGNQPLASFGVGPDGSVYSYSPDQEIIRLDPATGAILNISQPLSSSLITPLMAIDNTGILFVVRWGVLYSFNPDLTLRWMENIPNTEGLALGQNGILIVPGLGENVFAFQTLSVPDSIRPTCSVDIAPSVTTFTLQDIGSGLAEILVLDRRNVVVNVPPFLPGTTEPVMVTASLIPPHQRGLVMLEVNDLAGNSIICREKVEE